MRRQSPLRTNPPGFHVGGQGPDAWDARMDENQLTAAEDLIGYRFNDRALLKRSLTHASLADSRLDSNERLEFLGDAVLGLVVCEHLFENYEDLLEGEMTKIKSTVVSRRLCAEVAGAMGLADLIRLGKGMSNRRELPSSVVAAVYESLIGAIFVDGGIDAAREFILRELTPWIEDAAGSGHQSNYKSVLQQIVQQQLEKSPSYVLLDEQGPDHAKCFEVCVDIGARRFESCWGASKKQAEQAAAMKALVELGFAEWREDGELDLIDPAEVSAEPE